MDQPESEGVRLLSFDGGDIRAISQLLILDEFMRRIEWDRKSTSRILPCDYFHMMAGVGTGGIIVILLATLRMEIEEAIQEFIDIWTGVFADASLDQVARSAKLEVTIKDLLERKGLPENHKLYSGDRDDSACKAFLCAVPESNLGTCKKLRSYNSKATSTSPTIIEAIRATCAIPTLFTPVSVESVGCHVSYVTGAYNFNNPAWETIKEACETFGQSRLVACMLSLGCGQRPTTRLSQKNEAAVASLVNDIASDSELVDRDLAWRIGKSNVYYRLSVDRILESSGDSSLGLTGEITSFTKVFLEHPTMAEKVSQCTNASERLGRVTLTNISGLSEPKPATTHGLPSLSAFFVERPGLIKQMAQCLFRAGPPAQRRIVLSGLGGIGKTQITVSFLHQFLSRFRHVLFIDGSSVQSIESGVIAKVKSLGLTYSRTSASEALEVLANPDHEITRDWAIVYDNVDNRDINIADSFPHCSFGTIFITTRNRNLGNLAPNAHIELNVMSEEEAADVLLRSAFAPSHLITEADKQHAGEITKELGYLPVALVQAGYFIKIHNCIHDYRERLRKRRPDILSRPAQDQLDPHYHGVYATLNVTWPHLSPRAQNFMSILGFVNYTGFPITLLYRAADRGFLFEPLKLMDRPALFQQTIQFLCTTFRPDEESTVQDVDDLIAELKQYSLVTPMSTFNVETLSLHPLVHSWAHDRLSKQEKLKYREAVIRLLVCGTGSDDEDLYEFLYPHVTLLSDRLNKLHANDQAGLAAILAHQGDVKTAIELWEGIRRDIRVWFDQADVQSGEVDLQLARLYWDSKDVEKRAAASVLENEVVDIRKRALGPKHPMTMLAMIQLARGMKRDWKTDDAAFILKDALKFWECQPGDHWETILRVKEELAGCSDKKAIALRTEVLQVRMERSGPDHHATLKAMENLAREYSFISGRYNRDVGGGNQKIQNPATDTWISVVAARTRRRGIEHPDTLNAMESLAWSYRNQAYRGYSDESTWQWTKVIKLRKAVQGIYHTDTLNAMEALESSYGHTDLLEQIQQKKLREEIVCLRRDIVRLSKEAHGPSHKNTLEAMRELARIYERWSEYPEAEKEWKGVVCLTKGALGTHHEDTLEVMKRLAQVYETWEKHSKAEEQWKEIICLTREARSPNHEDTLGAMQSLANLYRSWKKKTGEEETRILLVSLTKEARGPSHQDTLDAMDDLTDMYKHWRQYDEAMLQWKEMVRSTQEAWGPNHEDTLKVMKRLAQVCENWEKHSDAEGQWKEIVRLTKEALGPNHEDTLGAMKALARICNPRKSYTEAVGQWKEIISLTREVQGPNHEDTVSAMTELAKVYEDWEKNTEAEETMKEIVCLTKEAQCPNHWGTLAAIRELAHMYERWSKYPEATVQWEEVVSLAKCENNPNDWSARRDMIMLAGMYEHCEQYTEAIAQLEKIISLEKEADDDDSWLMQLRESLAEIYERVGRGDEAVAQREEILRLKKDIEGPGNWEILPCLKDLARMYERREQYIKAAAKWEEIVQLTKGADGLITDDTLDAITQLAKISDSPELLTEWETQVKEDVRLARETKGLAHQDTIEAMTRLAKLYQGWRKFAESEDQWMEIIRLTKDAEGHSNWKTLRHMADLAKVYETCERYTEAIAQLEKIISLEKEADDDDSWLMQLRESLAEIYERVGRGDEAVAQREEILRLKKDIEGPGNWEILPCLKDLARMYERREQYIKAAAKWEEIVQLTKGADGLITDDTLDAITQLAKIRDSPDVFTEWETQVKEDVRLAREARGPGHRSTIKVLTGLAKLYQASGKHAEAEDQWKEVLGLTKDVEGSSGQNTLRYMRDLAKMYESCERYTEAAAQWEDILHLEKRPKSIYSQEPLDSMKNLARIYEKCELHTKAAAKWEEIVRLTREAHDSIHTLGGYIHPDALDAIARLMKISNSPEVLTEWETQVKEDVRLARETEGPAHQGTIGAMRRLAKLYQAWGKFTESEGQWKEIIRLMREAEGPSGWNTLEYMRDLAKMYEGCERYTEAIAQLEEILRLDNHPWSIDMDRKSLAEIHKRVGRIGRGDEAVTPREEIEQFPENLKDRTNREIITDARNLARNYEEAKEYTKAAALWEDILHLEEYDKDLEEYDEYWKPPKNRFYDAKGLAKMYMKLERYEEAETLLLDVRDHVPWESGAVISFRKLLEEVRSKSENTHALITR